MITVDGETETKYYYFHDAQGSIVALLNNSGTVVEGYTYGPYGEPTAGRMGKNAFLLPMRIINSKTIYIKILLEELDKA